ncbi:MAG: hypothetical protein ABI856_14535 [Nitrospira sp.]
MKQLRRALGAVIIPLAFVSCVAQHTCSGQEMIAMKESGFSTDEVKNNCTSYKIPDGLMKIADQAVQAGLAKNVSDQASPPVVDTNAYQAVSSRSVRRQAIVCATQAGQCPLTQPGSSGVPCTCYTLLGPLPGVTR